MIRQRAYQLYQERGYVSGFEQEDWITAEREVLSRHSLQLVLAPVPSPASVSVCLLNVRGHVCPPHEGTCLVVGRVATQPGF